MKSKKFLPWLFFLFLPVTASAWQWTDLWKTKDQQGSQLLQAGQAKTAAQVFKNTDWKSVSDYRASNYTQAYQQFSENKSSDGQYNAGNAAAFMGDYQKAIAAYDKAISLNSDNKDAVANREIIKKLLQQQSPQKDSKQSDREQKQQDAQKNSSSNGKEQQQPNNTQQNNQSNNNQRQDDKTQSATTSAKQKQDENSKQLLRRLADDPGSLLQQKFLRDYARRHGFDDDSVQGVN